MTAPLTISRSIPRRLADAWDGFRGVRAEPSPIRTVSGAAVHRRSVWKGAEVSRIYSNWIATLMAPNEELAENPRLRARAREMSRNNEYAGQFIEQCDVNMIGPDGPKFRATNRLDDDELDVDTNTIIEKAFAKWCSGPVTTDGMLSWVEYSGLALEGVVRDGESFPRRYHQRDFADGIGIQLVDPDLVDEGYTLTAPTSGGGIFAGVEVDNYGRRLAYHILDRPYGPGYAGRGRQRIAAGDILHVYRPKRANQMRGVTWLARAMAALQKLQDYRHNEVIASAAGAAKMGFIIRKNGGMGAVAVDNVADGADGSSGSGSSSATADASEAAAGGRTVVEAEPGTIWELEDGQEFQGWTPDHPSTAFKDFNDAILRGAASGLPAISFEALASNYSEVTYLSARAALLVERVVWDRLQKWWIRTFCQPHFEWWLQSAMLSGALELPGNDWRLYRNAIWIPRGRDWVDPGKDADAAEKLLALGLTTRTKLAAQRGDDFEEILEQLQKEKDLIELYGIDLGAQKDLPAPSDPQPVDPTYDAASKKKAAAANGNGKRAAALSRL